MMFFTRENLSFDFLFFRKESLCSHFYHKIGQFTHEDADAVHDSQRTENKQLPKSHHISWTIKKFVRFTNDSYSAVLCNRQLSTEFIDFVFNVDAGRSRTIEGETTPKNGVTRLWLFVSYITIAGVGRLSMPSTIFVTLMTLTFEVFEFPCITALKNILKFKRYWNFQSEKDFRTTCYLPEFTWLLKSVWPDFPE